MGDKQEQEQCLLVATATTTLLSCWGSQNEPVDGSTNQRVSAAAVLLGLVLFVVLLGLVMFVEQLQKGSNEQSDQFSSNQRESNQWQLEHWWAKWGTIE
jgi:hypothetical protein